jgi:F0F1-type ATP synthase epsilon subunit
MKVPRNESIPVEIRSRDKLLFDGQVNGLSGFDAKGQFDVLPHHSNLISVILKRLVLYEAVGQKEILLKRGVLQVIGGKVRAYVEL